MAELSLVLFQSAMTFVYLGYTGLHDSRFRYILLSSSSYPTALFMTVLICITWMWDNFKTARLPKIASRPHSNNIPSCNANEKSEL